MVLLKMLRYHGSLNRGETAGFSEQEATTLVEKGIAEPLESSAVEVEVAPTQHVDHGTPAPVAGKPVTEESEPLARTKKR